MVQRGNVREFQDNSVETSSASQAFDMASSVISQVATINKAAEQGKVSNNISKANVDLYKFNEQWKIDNQSDPNNVDAVKARENGFNTIFSDYGKNIGALGKKDWNGQAQVLKNSYSLSNAKWGVTTQRNNAVVFLNDTIVNNSRMAENLGKLGHVDGLLQLAITSSESLSKSGNAVLGEIETQKVMKNYEQDLMTNFISGAINTKPLEAMGLLEDERVKSAIDDDAVYSKLKEAAISKITSLGKVKMVEGISNFIKDKGAIGQKAIEGRLTLSELEGFIDKNDERLTVNQKKFLYKQAGFAARSSITLDEKGNVVHKKAKEIGLKAKEIGLKKEKKVKLSNLQKDDVYSGLIFDGSELLSGDAFKNIKPLSLSKADMKLREGFLGKGKETTDVQSNVASMMTKVSEYQDKINEEYDNGNISKTELMQLTNNYVSSVSEFLDANIKPLEESDGWFKTSLGYGQINEYKDSLNPDANAKQTIVDNIQMGLLRANYFGELMQVSKDKKLNNVYEIEKLESNVQKEIYRKAFDNSLRKTKRYSDSPAYWFNVDYGAEASLIKASFNANESKKVMNDVGSKLQQNPDANVSELTNNAIADKKAKENQAIVSPKIDLDTFWGGL